MIHAAIRYFWRDLKNKPGFYLMQFFGLSLGMLVCLFMLIYVQYHLSYDKQIPDYQNVYRVQYNRWGENGEQVSFASASPTIGPAIKRLFPEAKAFTRLYKTGGDFRYESNFFEEENVFQAESSVFDLLGIKVLEGDINSCLDETSSMALSASTAQKYFGNQDPIGKIIQFNQDKTYTVKAIFEDLEPNRHLEADIFISLSDWIAQNPELFSDGWFYSGFYTYVKFNQSIDPNRINQGIAAYIVKEFGDVLKDYGMGMSFVLQPVADIHLKSHYMHELKANSNQSTIDILTLAGLLTLIIAWINYFNLSTIAMLRRKKENLIRRINGAKSKHLFVHYLIWSAGTNIIAALLVVLLVEWVNPIFIDFAELPDDTMILKQVEVYFFLGISILAGTLSAGIYSASKPIKSGFSNFLKGNYLQSHAGRQLKKGLISFQFLIGIGVMAASLVIYQQFDKLLNYPPGYKTEGVVAFKAPGGISSENAHKLNTFELEINQFPFIEACAFSSVLPTQHNRFNRGGIRMLGESESNGHNFRLTETGRLFFDTYRIPIIYGEGFTGVPQTDKQRVLINELAAIRLGFDQPEDAVGKKLLLREEPLIISGIAKDFHQGSPKNTLEPQLFRFPKRNTGYFSVSLKTINKPNLDAIQKRFKESFPFTPFEPIVMSDQYKQIFVPEKRVSQFFGIFTFITLLITVLGLIGISANTAEIRKKEIGIRKTLGAGFTRLIIMLFKDYLWLWVIALAGALPLFDYFIRDWLQQFAQPLYLRWYYYLAPALLVLWIAVLTVGIQSAKVIKKPTVDSLRTE